MAIANANPQRTGKAGPQRMLLLDASRLSVRRVTRAEGDILSALTTLAPAQRSMLTTVVGAMQSKKRTRNASPPAEAA